jgi:septum formation protein
MSMSRLWTGPAPLLLASTSQTRRALLESAGLSVDTDAPGVNERAIEAEARRENLDPMGLAQRLAAEKALAVSCRHPERLVLGGVLACGPEIFHKPEDRPAARAQLERLAGRRHALHSAGALAQGGRVVGEFKDAAHLTMRPLTPENIDLYLALAGPQVLHSVGVYQLEGIGIHLFEEVEGDHSTILGLPLRPLLSTLRRLGLLAF